MFTKNLLKNNNRLYSRNKKRNKDKKEKIKLNRNSKIFFKRIIYYNTFFSQILEINKNQCLFNHFLLVIILLLQLKRCIKKINIYTPTHHHTKVSCRRLVCPFFFLCNNIFFMTQSLHYITHYIICLRQFYRIQHLDKCIIGIIWSRKKLVAARRGNKNNKKWGGKNKQKIYIKHIFLLRCGSCVVPLEGACDHKQ